MASEAFPVGDADPPPSLSAGRQDAAFESIVGLSLFAALLVLLYGHAVSMLAQGFWQTEDGAYSPFLILLSIGLAGYRGRIEPHRADRPSAAGVALFGAGCLALIAGRLLGNISIEYGSVLMVVPGILVALIGWRAPLRYGYALGTLAVSVPLPGSVVVMLTSPLKMAASACAATLLAAVGVPIDRQGVMIDIGEYRLMVVDACSGLQSMYSLTAAAFLYLALAGRRSRGRTLLLLAAVLPIAFAANVCRVVILALITFWFGDAAGEGFLHGFAGMTMFGLALLGIMALDRPMRESAGNER